jgi:hypothetical protein
MLNRISLDDVAAGARWPPEVWASWPVKAGLKDAGEGPWLPSSG